MTNTEKRNKITDLIVTLYDHLDPTKKNSRAFLDKTAKMNDTQFVAYFTALVNDPKKHLYFELTAFESEPSYDMVERAAYDIVGDEYCHLYDYIAFPDASDPDKPSVTVSKVFNGYINIRRVQQIVNHKNHIPTHNEKRDPKTGQVSMESKAARISDAEQISLIVQGVPNVLKEMFGPRGGDAVMRNNMEQQIAASGSCVLEGMEDSKLNKVSLNTANVYFIAAGLETDLVTKGGVLPRTIEKLADDAKSLKRDKIN